MATGQQRGTDADEYDTDKVGVRDFALWKAYKPEFDRDDAVWDTKIGKGRPGWHLECSAMAKKYLGETIDIHCGGIDLKFPHHENEIAQSEGANQKPFCNCWLHNGFVNIGDEKMSKSKGNFLTLRGACPSADDVRAYRYLVVSSQYRNPLSFTETALKASKKALKRMDKAREQLYEVMKSDSRVEENSVGDSKLASDVATHMENFDIAIADDLSTPRAAASLFAVVKAVDKEFKDLTAAENAGSPRSPDMAGLRAANDALDNMDKVFGIFYKVPPGEDEDLSEGNQNNVVPVEVLELASARATAKDAKDWALADELRDRIAELGFQVKDVKGGHPVISPIEQ